MHEFLLEHPIAAYTVAVFVVIVAVRTLVWNLAGAPKMCETCEHVGPARRVVQ